MLSLFRIFLISKQEQDFLIRLLLLLYKRRYLLFLLLLLFCSLHRDLMLNYSTSRFPLSMVMSMYIPCSVYAYGRYALPHLIPVICIEVIIFDLDNYSTCGSFHSTILLCSAFIARSFVFSFLLVYFQLLVYF